MKQRSSSAFTLIEVLMASTLTAIVVAAGFGTLSILLKIYKQQENRYSAADVAIRILDRINQDLTCTFFSPHQEVTRFVGMDMQTESFETDNLTFISTVNNAVQTGEGTSDLAEIQFYIDLDDATPERWLLRRCDVTPDIDPFSGGMISLLGPQVVSLDFQFFDGTEWWPIWDSSSAVPIAVNATVGLFQPSQLDEAPSPENVKVFTKMIWLANYRSSSGTAAATGQEPAAEESSDSGEQGGGGNEGSRGNGGNSGGGGRGGNGGGRGGNGGGGNGGGNGGGGRGGGNRG